MLGGYNLVECHPWGFLSLGEVRPRGHVPCEPCWGAREEPFAQGDVLVLRGLREGDKETSNPRRVWVLLFVDVGLFPKKLR